MAKKQRRFVPHLFLTATCAAQAVPACAVEACGGDVRQSTSGSSTGGAGGINFSVAAALSGGGRGTGGRVSTGGVPFSVGASAFGGFLGMAGGAFGVAAAGFGGVNRGGAGGGVASGGFGGFGGFIVAAAGFGGLIGMAGGAFTGGAGGSISGVADAAFGGTGGTTRDAGQDAAGSGGHASLEPDTGDRFGELSGARTGTKQRSVRRRGA
jgi:hypothetical protein